MPRLERSGLENRGQTAMMPGEFIQNLGQRNGAVADRAADETIAFVGKVDAIVAQRCTPTARGGDPTGEVERRLRDGKSVASVEADADAARFLTKSDQFVAAEVLVVLDRQRPAFVGCARSPVGERGPDIGDQRLPLLAERVPITAAQSMGRQRMTLASMRANRRAFQAKAHHQARTDDGRPCPASQ